MALALASDGVLYHSATGQVLLQHRSPDAHLNPDRWGLFGGGEEAIDAGDPVATWCRELHEELGIAVGSAHVRRVGERLWRDGTRETLFYCPWPTLDTAFDVTEAQAVAWFSFDAALALPNLAPGARYLLPELRELLARGGGA